MGTVSCPPFFRPFTTSSTLRLVRSPKAFLFFFFLLPCCSLIQQQSRRLTQGKSNRCRSFVFSSVYTILSNFTGRASIFFEFALAFYLDSLRLVDTHHLLSSILPIHPATMPKRIYRAVPGDEEQSRSSSDTIYEKENVATRLQDDKFERDVRTRSLDFLSKNWPWIAHTLLLSISLILFTLSFCQRTATAKITDLQVTQQYSSWCMFPFLHLSLLFP